MVSNDHQVTRLLHQWSAGEQGVLGKLLPLVYADLRRVASRTFQQERGNHTLQPTALVHEAYLKLEGSSPPTVKDSQHFLRLAARVMRQILVDHARRVNAARRLGQARQVPLEKASSISTPPALELIELDELLTELGQFDARKAQVIELRFFGGFKVTDVAKLIGVSVPTVVTDTRVALAWLLARHEENPTTNDDA
jgi:RNA polymerase sigma factor (TIGR02999 family)